MLILNISVDPDSLDTLMAQLLFPEIEILKANVKASRNIAKTSDSPTVHIKNASDDKKTIEAIKEVCNYFIGSQWKKKYDKYKKGFHE